MITRRDALKATGLAIGAALILPKLSAAAFAESVPVDGLMQPGPLGDVWLGPKDAKVTIIEYASMTCSHCAAFHKATYPTLKERYIDTGKVRFTLREFPLDPLATAAFMLARCDGDAKYYPITDLLFDQQPAWAFTPKPVDALEQMLKQAGDLEGKVRDLPQGPEALRRRERRETARARDLQGRFDADLLHQRRALHRRDDGRRNREDHQADPRRVRGSGRPARAGLRAHRVGPEFLNAENDLSSSFRALTPWGAETKVRRASRRQSARFRSSRRCEFSL